MVKSITILATSFKENVSFSSDFNAKISVDCKQIASKSNSFTIEFVFNLPIVSFRNHDYSWIDVNETRIAASLSSKILKLSNGFIVQANIHNGIWEVSPKNKKVLLWKFNPEYSNSLTEYTGIKNTKKLVSANSALHFVEQPSLLFTKADAIEISRSKIPFSAIACFTDHCDYDTLPNLKLQRQLFAKTNIKTTKGFFLNHFSKRNDNASFENDKKELEFWKNDGHELCYHSLSQSIKSDAESFEDFQNFQPPFDDIPVWIDHGFQPYNFSLYKNNKFSNTTFEKQLSDKKIQVLWNYIDSGTATSGVINQLNTTQFTLNNYRKGIAEFSFKTKLVMLFKNIIFHFDNDENRVRNYIDAVANARAIIKKKQFLKVFTLIKNIVPLLMVVLKVLFLWNSEKNKPYKVARFAPILFKHRIDAKDFFVFQTLEMVDFKKALNSQNIESLISESGVFIAHTYFSVDMSHYSGKLFKQEGVFDDKVVANFENLSLKIRENKIWNPTLSQLIEYFNIFEETVFDIDTHGVLYIKNPNNLLSSRIIN